MTTPPDGFAGLPKELQDELRGQLESMIGGPSFQPFQMTDKPGGAPDHIATFLDMYNYGLDQMLEVHANALRVNPVEPEVSAQDTLERLAVCGFSTHEIAGLLAAALDRLARQRVLIAPTPREAD